MAVSSFGGGGAHAIVTEEPREDWINNKISASLFLLIQDGGGDLLESKFKRSTSTKFGVLLVPVVDDDPYAKVLFSAAGRWIETTELRQRKIVSAAGNRAPAPKGFPSGMHNSAPYAFNKNTFSVSTLGAGQIGSARVGDLNINDSLFSLFSGESREGESGGGGGSGDDQTMPRSRVLISRNFVEIPLRTGFNRTIDTKWEILTETVELYNPVTVGSSGGGAPENSPSYNPSGGVGGTVERNQ